MWAIVFTYLGLAFGGAALRFLHFTTRLDVKLTFLAILLMAVLGVIIWMRIRGERATRLAEGRGDDA